MATLHTIKRRLFQEDGSLYPSGTVVYFTNADNSLVLDSGSVGTWVGTYGSNIQSNGSYTISSSSGEVGFSSTSSGRYALMVKPSVDTNGLISNYIDTTSITIPLPVAFVTSGTSTQNNTLTLSGLQSGDFVMYATCGDGGNIYTNISATNSGSITSLTTVGNGDDTDSKIFYYFVTGTDTVITPSTGGNRGNNLAVVFRNVDASNPLDVTYTTNTSSGNPDPPNITTVTSPTMIVVFGASTEDDEDPQDMTLTASSGYTLAAFSNQHNNSEAIIGAAYKEHTSTGSENPGAFSVNDKDGSIAYTFALRGES
jgi:hypothetical protein